MKWTSQQFILPVLLGFSLTGVSIAVIYLWYKRDEENLDSRKHPIATTQQKVIECKVPREFVPAIIGRGGSVIKDIQNKTGTEIHFTEDNIEYPYRICLITGSFGGISVAEQIIESIIKNQPIIETYEMYIPRDAYERIIERGGRVMKQIQTSSSAKLIIENSQPYSDSNAERRIIIKGTAEQIAAALSQIEDTVREEKEERKKLEAASTNRLPRGKLSPRNTALYNSESTNSTEHLPLQAGDGLMKVYVSAMENPSQFWVQIVGSGTAALDKLVSSMTEYYNQEENREIHVLKNITLGQIVAAKFSFDEQWYRAEIISMPEDGYCEVYFVDYGDHEMVQVDCVLELRTDFLSLRLQAVECSLANVKSREDEWSVEACDKFAELTSLAQWKVLVAKVRGYKERALSYGRSRREGSPIPCVDLYNKTDDKETSIGQELVNDGFAEHQDSPSSIASSTLSLSTRTQDVSATGSPASSSPLLKRALNTDKSESKSNESDLNTDTPTNTRNGSDLIPGTPKVTSTQPNIIHIDLTTPQKAVSEIEEIDLVTPVKGETSRFIDNERKVHHENGSGDYWRNGNTNQPNRFRNNNLKISPASNFAPAGYESDLSDDSDGFELG